MGDQPTSLSQALTQQRQSKDRTKEDVKLLANRIAMLKAEEKKVRAAHGSDSDLTERDVGMEEDRRNQEKGG